MPESEKKEESAESREEAKEQVCNKQKKKLFLNSWATDTILCLAFVTVKYLKPVHFLCFRNGWRQQKQSGSKRNELRNMQNSKEMPRMRGPKWGKRLEESHSFSFVFSNVFFSTSFRTALNHLMLRRSLQMRMRTDLDLARKLMRILLHVRNAKLEK